MSPNSEEPLLGFVIPAFNEEEGIAVAVASILEHCPRSRDPEIVVVDHRSTDGTAAVARSAGATVVPSAASTIAGVRNDGERHLRSDVVVFLDADCVVTGEWGATIEDVIERLRSYSLACAGAQVYPPSDEDVFLWKYWFAPFVDQQSASHVGSANMVCLRRAFQEIGGFDERLETGEDFDLCHRIVQAGGTILNVPKLRVEHRGFPRRLSEFLARERWHGRGDASSFGDFFGSKVAMASTGYVLLVLLGVAALALGAWVVGAGMLCLAFLIVLGSSLAKFSHAGPAVVLANLCILPVYFVGRALSILDVVGLTSSLRKRSQSR